MQYTDALAHGLRPVVFVLRALLSMFVRLVVVPLFQKKFRPVGCIQWRPGSQWEPITNVLRLAVSWMCVQSLGYTSPFVLVPQMRWLFY